MQRFYADAWNRWDDDAVDELLTADFVFRGSLGDHAHGRDGFRAYRDKVRSAFPDFHNEVREVVAEKERAAVRLRVFQHFEQISRDISLTYRFFKISRTLFYEMPPTVRTREARRPEAQAAWASG